MRRRALQRPFGLLLTCGFVAVLCADSVSAFGRRQKVPVWVSDPMQIDTLYPRSLYLVGIGVSAGASKRDMVGRKAAENSALADVAANVEVQIHDTLETHDSEVFRGGKSLQQSVRYQTTKRVVRGLLSGTEIKETFFDRRTMTWHALAVLERAKAGRGGVAAINERLTKAEAALATCGQGKPLSDFVALRGLEKTEQELDWLAFAVAMFVPSKKAMFSDRIAAFTRDRAARLEQVRGKIGVKVEVRSDDGQAVPSDFVRGLEAKLKAFGFPVVKEGAKQTFEVALEIVQRDQVGAMRLVNVRSGARYVLQEGREELIVGRFEPTAATASRARSPQMARQTSLGKLQSLLLGAIEKQLVAKMGGENSQ